MSDARWTIHPLQEALKEEARRQGLWNLWVPAGEPKLPKPVSARVLD